MGGVVDLWQEWRAACEGEEVPFGRWTWDSACGNVRIVLDVSECDFHMECATDADVRVIETALDNFVFGMGLELIPEDECPPETTDQGWTRIYCTPIKPVVPGDRNDYGLEAASDAGSVSAKLLVAVAASSGLGYVMCNFIPTLVEVLS